PAVCSIYFVNRVLRPPIRWTFPHGGLSQSTLSSIRLQMQHVGERKESKIYFVWYLSAGCFIRTRTSAYSTHIAIKSAISGGSNPELHSRGSLRRDEPVLLE